MTTQYAGLDLWAEEISHVSDDDTRDASAYAISAIGLADRTRYLKNRGFYSTPAFGVDPFTNTGTYRIAGQIIFTSSAGIAITYASAHRYARTANLLAYADIGDWVPGISLSVPAGDYTQDQVVSAAKIVFDFDIPSNCVLKRFVIRVQGDAAHVNLPENMPQFLTYLVDTVAGTTTVLVDGSAIDTSATNAAYKLLHTLSVELSNVYNFDASRHRIFMVFLGEWGAVQAIPGLTIQLPTVEFERAQVGEEFGELVP